ncbi:TadE/TadG family type IV pilus assembly protein [Acetobacterium sp.]|uniref:TadE/TadG family type IV pilus assembly protein n=1 Tax=Acetobacterium sp. TaxID=1872094 RepID=UPI003593FC88
MFANIIKRIKKEDGQAVVELALTLPILIMILCGIIDFGWLFTNQNSIDNCAREGARYAIVNSTSETAIEDHIRAIAPENIADTIEIDITFSNVSNPQLGDVIVIISDEIDILTPIVGVFVQGETMNLSSSCTMKVE